MFEGAFYYDFANGVQVLETEAMRFKLAKWRKNAKFAVNQLHSPIMLPMSLPHCRWISQNRAVLI